MEENFPVPSRTFLWPELSEERVLVVGLGGGSDIISAYALVRHLAPEGDGAFVYANTKTRAEPDWLHLTPHIARLPGAPSTRAGPGRVRELPTEPGSVSLSQSARQSDESYRAVRREALTPRMAQNRAPGRPSGAPEQVLRIKSGSTAIDRCIPRGARGCPWIVWLQKEPGEEEALSREIQAQGFTRLIAVDTGGDVLHRSRRPGGVGRHALGRDQRMLSVLRRTELPGWLVVIAPGADGQSAAEKMRRDLERACREESFVGTFPLTGLLPVYRELAPHLPPTRTPCLILNAHESEEERMLIPRGRRPEIPIAWLRAGFVFSIP